MNGYILIQVADEISLPIDTRLDLHEPGSKQLKLYTTQYTPFVENQILTLQQTGSGAYLDVTKTRKGFDAKFLYEGMDEYIAVNIIAKYHMEKQIPLTINDYVNIEPEMADYNQGFTIREGFILLPISASPQITDDSGYWRYVGAEGIEYEYIQAPRRRLTNGFSFSFRESGLRLT